MLSPRTDLVTIASLVAENATLAADLHDASQLLREVVREMPPGNYSPVTEFLRNAAHASPEELAAMQAELRTHRA